MFRVLYIDDDNRTHMTNTTDIKYLVFLKERFVVLRIVMRLTK